MSYPKPLSTQSLEKKYSDACLTGDQRVFLHLLFSACSNLYGVIHIRDVWDVYRKITDYKPKIHRKDLIAFSSIVQREEQPYFVLDESELFVDGSERDTERYIVNGQIVGKGPARYAYVYDLLDNQGNRPYNVPDNFLGNSISVPSIEETMLLDYLRNLKITLDEYENEWGVKFKCEDKGKRLGETDTLSFFEKTMIELEKRPSFREHLEKTLSGSKAERMLRKLKLRINIGTPPFGETVKYLFQEIDENGVVLSEKEDETLLSMIQVFNNKSRLWHNCGWSPYELSIHLYGKEGAPAGLHRLSIGPNMREHFQNNPKEWEDFLRKAKEMGIEVDDNH